MTCYLYQNGSEANVVDKDLQNETEFDIILLENQSVKAPAFRIKTDTNMSFFNYCYIPTFGRYYFIKDKTVTPNGIWTITTEKTDVLSSWKTHLRELYAIVARQEAYENANTYLPDTRFPVSQRPTITVKQFDMGFTGIPQFILTTIGTVEGQA